MALPLWDGWPELLPRLAHGTWGPLYAASLAPLLTRYRGAIDVVLATWAYPDGFGGVVLARMLGVPDVVKLHGSDINHIARMPGPRRQLRWAGQWRRSRRRSGRGQRHGPRGNESHRDGSRPGDACGQISGRGAEGRRRSRLDWHQGQ